MSPRSETTSAAPHQRTTAHAADGLPAGAAERITEVFSAHVRESSGGLAFSLYREGRPLLRLTGGVTERDGEEPWNEDTMAVLFSGTKGVVATLAAQLTDRGLLDPQAPVAEYWPEFAAAGKADVRVHHVLSHTLGLLYADPEPAAVEERVDNARMAEILAAQAPLWEPGTKVAYHATTYGYLLAEILLRITGKGVGELVRTELSEPWGLDLHLGLPESEEPRVAPIHQAPGYRVQTFLRDDPERRAVVDRMYGALLTGDEPLYNSRLWHAAELASGGAVGTADAMAKLYSLLIAPEAPLVSAETLALYTRTWSEGTDAVNDRPLRFGLGYELDDPIGTYGPVRPAFGHTGAGGGLHGAWPERGLTFSLLTNEMQSEDVDTRAKDLLGAVADLDI
jgi:CubicO group peptidase (beta-lactamase class C family)